MLTDTHAHLNILEDAEAAVQNALAAAVRKIIVPATEPADFAAVMALSERYDNVFGLLGVHPTEASGISNGVEDEIERLIKQNPKIIGIGEIGLDYYHRDSSERHSEGLAPEESRPQNDVSIQKDVFIRLLKLANRLGLPVNVHDREAHEDTFDILQKYNHGSKVVMHCFSGDLEFAHRCVDAGYYLGIGGIVTFKNAHTLKEVAAVIPLEHIVLETDAPFLAPVPHRGEQNQPAFVKFVAEEIAALRGMTFKDIARITTQNAKEIFNL